MAAIGLVYIYTSMSHPGHKGDLYDLAAMHGNLQNTHGMLQSRDALKSANISHTFINVRAVNNDVA